MIYFPDVNVWIALYSPGHVHQAAALEWFGSSPESGIAFSRITQMGFLRLLTNRHVMGINMLNPASAWQAYDEFLQNARIFFAHEPPSIEKNWRALTEPSDSGANAWTDAYLAAFANQSGYTLVTFDTQLARRQHRGARLLKC
jgi:uncharacterized protein